MRIQMKKTMMLSLALLIAAFMLPCVAFAAEHTHDGYVEWTDSLAQYQYMDNTKNAGNSLPKEPGSYYLGKDVTLTETWGVTMNTPMTDLCLNGHKIIGTDGSTPTIEINENSSLYIYDEHTDDEAGYISKSTDTQKGEAVWNKGTLYMYGGRIGGVDTGVNNCGDFFMYGGEISGNEHNGAIVVGEKASLCQAARFQAIEIMAWFLWKKAVSACLAEASQATTLNPGMKAAFSASMIPRPLICPARPLSMETRIRAAREISC